MKKKRMTLTEEIVEMRRVMKKLMNEDVQYTTQDLINLINNGDIFEHIKFYGESNDGNPVIDFVFNVLDSGKTGYNGQVELTGKKSKVRVFVEFSYHDFNNMRGFYIKNIKKLLLPNPDNKFMASQIKFIFQNGQQDQDLIRSFYTNYHTLISQNVEDDDVRNELRDKLWSYESKNTNELQGILYEWMREKNK